MCVLFLLRKVIVSKCMCGMSIGNDLTRWPAGSRHCAAVAVFRKRKSFLSIHTYKFIYTKQSVLFVPSSCYLGLRRLFRQSDVITSAYVCLFVLIYVERFCRLLIIKISSDRSDLPHIHTPPLLLLSKYPICMLIILLCRLLTGRHLRDG